MQFVYTCIKLQACTSLSISTCIDERIRSFLQYHRLEFPDASITPKLHTYTGGTCSAMDEEVEGGLGVP